MRWEKAPAAASRVRVTPELVDVGPGHAPAHPVAGTVRCLAHRRVPGPGRHREQGGGCARRGPGRQCAPRPDSPADPEPGGVRRLPERRGRFAGRWGSADPSSLRPAIAFYEQAVALDSSFVPAWAQLARARALLYFNGTPTPELAPCRPAARPSGPRRSARTGPKGSWRWATYYRFVVRDNRQALAAYEAGLKLAPNNVDLLGSAAWPSSAWAAGTRRCSISPGRVRSTPARPTPPRRIGTHCSGCGATPRPRRPLDRGLALAPDQPPCHRVQGHGGPRPG